MNDGPDLLTMLREHDLPPRWDGRAVWWDGWRPSLAATSTVFICGPGSRAGVGHQATPAECWADGLRKLGMAAS